VNTYGSLSAYIIGMFLRLAGGENLIGLPALIHYPLYKESEIEGEPGVQLFPFRTFAMLISMTTLISVSQLAK
jgi:high affinity choline transporter 7